MTESPEATLEHSVKVRKIVRYWVDKVVGSELRRRAFVKVLPVQGTVDELDYSEHATRNYTFCICVVVLAGIGVVVLEIARLIMNCIISRRRAKRDKQPEYKPKMNWMKKKGNCCKFGNNNNKNNLENNNGDTAPLLGDNASVSGVGQGTQSLALGGEGPNVVEEWEPPDSDAEEEVEKTRRGVTGYTPQDLYYVAYHTFYAFGCLSITGYAVLNDYMSKHYGLDYEFYIIWVLYIVALHGICFQEACKLALKCYKELPTFWLSIPKSFNPFEGHLGILRDAVSSGIYVQEWFRSSGWVDSSVLIALSVVSTVGIFLPNAWIFRDVNPLRDFQETFWPTLVKARHYLPLRKEAKAGDGICGMPSLAVIKKEWWRWTLQFLDRATRQHKQATTILGDFPQACCGGIFLWRYDKNRNAYFVFMATMLAVFKAVVVLGGRPPILCLMARNKVKWSRLTPGDIKQGTIKNRLVKWILQSEACRELLDDPETTPEAMVEAVRCIRDLHASSPKETEEEEEEANEAKHAVLWVYTKESDSRVKNQAEKFLVMVNPATDNWRTASVHLRRLISEVASEKREAIKLLTKDYAQFAPAFVSVLYEDLSRKSIGHTISRSLSKESFKESLSFASDGEQQKRRMCGEVCCAMVHAQREYWDIFCCCCCCCCCCPEDREKAAADNTCKTADEARKEEINNAFAKDWKELREVRYTAAKALADLATLSAQASGSPPRRPSDSRPSTPGETEADKRRAAEKAIKKVAKDVVGLLGSNDREISNAALVVVVAFRSPNHVTLAVNKAMELLNGEDEQESNGKGSGEPKAKGSGVTAERQKVAEVALVHLLPYLPHPDDQERAREDVVDQERALYDDQERALEDVVDQERALQKLVKTCFSAGEVRATTLRVMERLGGRTARLALKILSSREDLDMEMKTLLEVLKIQDHFCVKMDNDWKLCRSMNLNFEPNPEGNRLERGDLAAIGKGAEVYEVLAKKQLAFELRSEPDNHDPSLADQFVLPVIFTDLEPDDTMFIAEMWKLQREKEENGDRKCCQPLVIYGVDLSDKDAGSVLEKKLTLAALVLGRVDLRVLGTSGDAKADDVKKRRVHGVRETNINAIRQRLTKFCGEVNFYVCGPGRGNLGDIVFGLPAEHKEKEETKTAKKVELMKNKTFNVSLYSGEFNIKNMKDDDIEAFLGLLNLEKKDEAASQNVLHDISKYLFWGGENQHPDVGGLSTFAMPSFAPLLACKHPEITYIWASLNNEFNRKLIAPKKLFDKALAGPAFQAKKKRCEELYDETSDVTDFAKYVLSEEDLWTKVVPKKQLTVKNFAYRCCDAPLCDQLLFVEAWVAVRQHYSRFFPNQPEAEWEPSWVRTSMGQWSFDKRTSHTHVDPNGSNPRAPMAEQPVLQFPCNTMAIYRISEALQDYTLSHLHDLWQAGRRLTLEEARNYKLF